MNGLRFILVFVLVLMFAAAANAQYWFQFGALAGNSSGYNTGVSAEIQTVAPQDLYNGSLGFWIGENLTNGAFLQEGYVIQNASGTYPNDCTLTGCASYVNLTAGNATWFYEYFYPNTTTAFLGSTGADGSAGVNGTWNNYAFYSVGDVWYFTFNGNVIGSVNLNASSSGPNTPTAFGELANTSNASTYIRPVFFKGFSVKQNGRFVQVQNASALTDYGNSSLLNLSNPYGMAEVPGQKNYFEMGSIPQPANFTVLWNTSTFTSYSLGIASAYANLSGNYQYPAYANLSLFGPPSVQLPDGQYAKFVGWSGSGPGSYTGSAENTTLQLDGNVTETAHWSLPGESSTTSIAGEFSTTTTIPQAQPQGSGSGFLGYLILIAIIAAVVGYLLGRRRQGQTAWGQPMQKPPQNQV